MTSQEIATNPAVSATFTINRPYPEAYRSVRAWAKSCFETAGFLGGGTRVDTELYTDLKRGEIQIYALGGVSPAHMFRIEIEPISATTSKMTVKKALREVVGDWDKKFVLVANSPIPPDDCTGH